MHGKPIDPEYHVRHAGWGAIAYHHVTASYIARFSRFIPCGAWEGIYLIDAFQKDLSDIQPDTVHADTHGQSTAIFALTFMLGIKLMPRIRNWKDLDFYRPDANVHYQHIDSLFSKTIEWNLIESHCQDLLQAVLSIRAGKIVPSVLLKKLGTYSQKNRLSQAAHELGHVVRTVFLLTCLSNPPMRREIADTTLKVESFNGFLKWIDFAGGGIIAENDPEEQEKVLKYMDLMANAIILQNTMDLTAALNQLVAQEYPVAEEDVRELSPYFTAKIKRFGDYVIDLKNIPTPLENFIKLNLKN